MKRSLVSDFSLFCVLVILGVTARLLQRDLPNFMPVAAISLFAGYYFTHLRWSLLVAPFIMLISDCCIGFHQPEVMASVYIMLTLPVLARLPLRRMFQLESNTLSKATISMSGLVGCSLLASISFFLVTNFVCWIVGANMYPHTLAGLIDCYTRAIPFFRNTLLGDLFFSFVVFGIYATVLRLGWATSARNLQPAFVRVK